MQCLSAGPRKVRTGVSAPTSIRHSHVLQHIFRFVEKILEVIFQELTSLSFLSIINVYNQLDHMSLSESLVVYDQFFAVIYDLYKERVYTETVSSRILIVLCTFHTLMDLMNK